MAEPPEVAGLEQQTEQKRRLEARDEARRKQREARNRQITMEREKKLREARRAAALAAWSQANNEIEWTEESDAGPEHSERQPPSSPAVADDEAREHTLLPKEAEQRFTEPLTQERPVEKAPVTPGIARAPQQVAKATVSGKAQVKSLLLAGRWNNEGKPAVLLPSELTYCEAREKHIKCWIVPQNSNTE